MTLAYDTEEQPVLARIKQQLELGNEQMEQGKYEESSRYYDEALKIKLPYTRYLNKGISLAKSDRHEGAIQCFDDVIELMAGIPELFHKQSNKLWQCEHVDRKRFQRSEERMASCRHAAFYQKAISLLKLGKFDDAKKYMAKIHKIQKYQMTFKSLCTALDSISKHALADHFQTADPKNLHQSFNSAGNKILDMGMYEEAACCFYMAIALKSNYYDAFIGAGLAFQMLGKYDDAMFYFETAIMLKGANYEALFHKACLLDRLGSHYESSYLFDDVIGRKPDHFEAHFHKGLALSHMNKHKDATACFDAAIKIKPDYFPALYSKGDSLYRLGMYGLALKCYDHAIKAKPQAADVKSKRKDLQKKMKNVPKRIWLPMLIIKNTNGFGTIQQLQNIAYLVQRESKRNDYNFEQCDFGPYSDEFVSDVSDNPELISKNHLSGLLITYDEYFLTEKGKKHYSNLKKTIGASIIDNSVAGINKYKNFSRSQLSEFIYSKFHQHPLERHDIKEIINELDEIKGNVLKNHEKLDTWQHEFVEEMLEHLKDVFSNAGKIKGNVEKNMIFNISKIILYNCRKAKIYLDPLIDADGVRPILGEIEHQTRFLLEYCKIMKITNDPYSKLPEK